MAPGPEAPAKRDTLFAPFRVRAFRFLWTADLLTASAIEMEILILGWYVLVETGSVVMLALLGAMPYIGTLLAPAAGMLGDRVGLRRLLIVMRAFYFCLAGSLAALAFLGLFNPFIAIAFAGLSGLARSSDIGMRSALCAEIMPIRLLMRAMGISRTTADSARALGALTGAGLFGLLGIGPAYLVVASCHLLGCLLTFGARSGPAATADGGPTTTLTRPSPWREIILGLAYVWRTPHLMAAMWLAFLVNLCAFPLTSGLLPYVAREIYGLDQNGLGLLVACYAVGSLVGSLTVSVFGSHIRAGRTTMVTAVVWYSLLAVFPHVPTLWGGMAMLAIIGLTQSLCMVPMAAMLLRTASVEFRGRVMGARMLAINSLPFGLLAAGPLIEHVGFRSTITAYALFGLALVIVIAVGWRRYLFPLDAPANRR
jgi:MFS family permease